MSIRQVAEKQVKWGTVQFRNALDESYTSSFGSYPVFLVNYPDLCRTVECVLSDTLPSAQEQLRDYQKNTYSMDEVNYAYRAMTQACIYEKMLINGSGLMLGGKPLASAEKDVVDFVETINDIKNRFVHLYGRKEAVSIEKTIAEDFTPEA